MSKRNMSNTKKVDSEESEPESEISDVDTLNTDNSDITDEDYDNDDDIDDNELLKKENDEDDETECLYNIEQNETNNIQNNDVPKEDRITKPFLTKYEKVRVLGTRAKLISLGAKILVKNIDLTTKKPLEIAKIELEHGVIPFKIRRALPNGKVEEWKISELIKKN
jgi:DNA-directed RNA polymerase I, II, and III subunit RPABC2